MAAPDTRISQAQMRQMREYRNWTRCEAVGAREIEKVSLILSRQMFEQKKKMKVQQVMREMNFLKQQQFAATLRKATNFSAADVKANDDRRKFWEKREEMAIAVIASEFKPEERTTALAMEVREKSTSASAHIGQKPEGVV